MYSQVCEAKAAVSVPPGWTVIVSASALRNQQGDGPHVLQGRDMDRSVALDGVLVPWRDLEESAVPECCIGN